MTIGEKIARRRTELGMSQMQLAIKSGHIKIKRKSQKVLTLL